MENLQVLNYFDEVMESNDNLAGLYFDVDYHSSDCYRPKFDILDYKLLMLENLLDHVDRYHIDSV
jgi:hypothetical protein